MSPAEIREFRSKLGMTARQFASGLGVAPDEVFAWERGERFPTKRHVGQMQSLADKAESKGATPPERRDTSTRHPYEASRDPRFWLLTRKLLAHEELLEKAVRLAEGYADPIDAGEGRSTR